MSEDINSWQVRLLATTVQFREKSQMLGAGKDGESTGTHHSSRG